MRVRRQVGGAVPGITTEFREIVEAHQSRVYSIAYRVLGDRGTAEEVAQDVFLELYRTLHDIASDEHLTAWLRRVAVHRATDALRRRPRTLHGAAEFEDWMAETPHEEGPLPLASEIERLLLTLPPTQRAVVLLRYQEDLLPGEIAETLGMPTATVKSHLQRALKLMRAKAEDTLKEYTRHG
jgi:RNA polymerase sigma-70 factor (ECF subfamily)